jgi:hypothetical protein
MLGSLFGIKNQSRISETITSVATVLEKNFVNMYLGLNHLSRENALQHHSRNMYYCLFEEENTDANFLVLDGTYVYVEKSRDFEIQRLTYSAQKKRNLIKPFMIVLPSGYILDAPIFFANGES